MYEKINFCSSSPRFFKQSSPSMHFLICIEHVFNIYFAIALGFFVLVLVST